MAIHLVGRLALGLAGALILGDFAGTRLIGADAAKSPIDRNVGRRMSDFTLKTTGGDSVRLYGFAREKKKAVVTANRLIWIFFFV